ncbi:DUF3219 family protein [Virgibacillus halophilus]|uniref:DUF3219 family protein n=1 Tax=Tigheibacillus halophilus TaxID=361280 RepID=A0ABU5CAH0_9BACI|nr:DUF3219 family protein [Virgibacillus halophilus]
MVRKIFLNDKVIYVEQYKEEEVQGFKKIAVSFKVTSEAYHDIATLLYEEVFDVAVPEKKAGIPGENSDLLYFDNKSL